MNSGTKGRRIPHKSGRVGKKKRNGVEIKMKKGKKPQTSRGKNLINYSIRVESDYHASHEGALQVSDRRETTARG